MKDVASFHVAVLSAWSVLSRRGSVRVVNVCTGVPPSGQLGSLALERLMDVLVLTIILFATLSFWQVTQLDETLLAGLRLVALSADALPEQISATLAAGFETYLTKPIDFRKFLEVLDSHLNAEV